MSNTATVTAPAGATETNLTNNSATDNDTVADAPVNVGSFTPPQILTASGAPTGKPLTHGTQFTQTVFTVKDFDPNASVTDYTAVIVLGDGNTVTVNSTGVISASNAATAAAAAGSHIVDTGNGTFSVVLTYTYQTAFTNHTFGVTLYDNGDGRDISDPTDSVANALTSTFTVK